MWFTIGAALAALIGLMLWLSIAEQRQWETFKAEHSCALTARTEGRITVATGISNGHTVTMQHYEPGQTGWLCDDGVTYWHSN